MSVYIVERHITTVSTYGFIEADSEEEAVKIFRAKGVKEVAPRRDWQTFTAKRIRSGKDIA